jgi:hypothetical protein
LEIQLAGEGYFHFSGVTEKLLALYAGYQESRFGYFENQLPLPQSQDQQLDIFGALIDS